MDIKKCKKPGCDARVVKQKMCGGSECRVVCSRCNLKEGPLSEVCIAEMWERRLKAEGLSSDN